MKKALLIAMGALVLFASCSKDDNGGKGEKKENPNPSTISKVSLVGSNLVVDPDGFNMLTDGGFERFVGDTAWKAKSLWYLPEWISEAETAYSGSRTIHADCNVDGWRDVAVQTIALKKNQSYTYTMNYRGAWDGLNVYIGFRKGTSGDVISDQNLNAEGVGSDWKEYTFTLNNVDEVLATPFMGGWCWWNLWLEADDFKVIPSGTDNDTFLPQDASATSTGIVNASYTEVASIDGVVSWIDEDGTISSVLNGAKVGEESGMRYSASNDKDITDGLRIATVSETPIISDKNAVATGGVSVDGTKYVKYYVNGGVPVATEDNPDPTWIATASGLLKSSDGQTWESAGPVWSADGNFVNASFCQKDSYVYMFGSAAGDGNRSAYVARVAEGSVENAAEWEYWDGGEWAKGDETAAAPVFYGPVSNMSVVYNSGRYTFMAVYYSDTTGALVYRDAGLPEGEWTGEKLLLEGDGLKAPQILSVTNDKIWFIATEN